MSVLTRLFLAVALSGVAGCAVQASTAPPPPIVVAAPDRSPPPAPGDALAKSFRDNLRRAQEDAKRVGWLVEKVVEVPGQHAAIVIYAPSAERAPAHKLARFDAVGAGDYQVISGESGIVDVMETPKKELLWDLRGGGSSYVVLHLTPCGANCGQAEPRVLELKGGRFSIPTSAPTCPTCMQDFDRDRVPEFSFRLAKLVVAPCARVSCGPSYALEVEVRGLESWEGGGFSRELRDFIPIYFDRLTRARRDAARARKARDKGDRCPLNAMRLASELYVYGRLIGESEADAMKDADAVMDGYGMSACEKEYDLLGPPRPWVELKKELLAIPLPNLKLRRAAEVERQGSK